MGGKIRNHLTALTQHVWSDEQVAIITTRGKAELNTAVFNLNDYGLTRGGLFEEVVRSVPCPILHTTINVFQRAITKLVSIKEIREALNTPANKLSSEELIRIARTIDSIALALSPKQPAEASRRAWKVFKYCISPLLTGEKIADLYFKTEHKEQRDRGSLTTDFKDLISSRRDDFFAEPELAAPIGAINYSSPSEQISKSLWHLKERLGRIESICSNVLEKHLNIKKYLNDIKARDLSEFLTPKQKCVLEKGGKLKPKVLKKLSVESRIAVYLFLLERDKYYMKRGINLNIYLDESEILTSALLNPNSYQLASLLLSTYFLPSHVLTACFILIAIATAWNKSTVIALSTAGIRKKGWGYELTSIKAKTDKIQTSQIDDRDNFEEDEDYSSEENTGPSKAEIKRPSAVLAIELLLQNSKMKEHLGYDGENDIFSSFRRNGPEPYFAHFRVDVAISDFRQQHQLQRFSTKEIRDQVAAIEYLEKNQNIYSVQSLLQHSSAETTVSYLTTTIFKALHESNINRFMLILQKDILFVTGRTKTPSATLSSKNGKQSLLLFPISHLSTETVECTIDKWLSFGAPTKITLGADEIRHCSYQYTYYVKSLQILMQQNPERFIQKHLPRIVVCFALYKLILASPHSALLKQYEGAYLG